MRISISRTTDAESTHAGTRVEVVHGLNNEGRLTQVFATNNVVMVEIWGYGILEIDLTREDAEGRVFRVAAEGGA